VWGRKPCDALGQLAGDGAEQLTPVRVPLVVFEREKYHDSGTCEALLQLSRRRADHSTGTRVVGGSGNGAWASGSIRTFHDKPTPSQDMTAARRFSGPALEELAKARILGVRAGSEHRYTGVWVVVVEGRVFVRSWNDRPTGWYRAFQAQPLGSIQLAGREIPIRARRLRGERLRDAVTRAYAGKYDTKASEKWVCGFAEPHRCATTLELLPVQPSPAPEVSR
jgi:hypothetical protein